MIGWFVVAEDSRRPDHVYVAAKNGTHLLMPPGYLRTDHLAYETKEEAEREAVQFSCERTWLANIKVVDADWVERKQIEMVLFG